jgi:transcriptional regulator with XRE-family HTH domain
MSQSVKKLEAARPFHEIIARYIDSSAKTQREICTEMGYTKPNLITMFKQGATKVPIEKVPLLAKAVGADAVFFLRAAMRDYMPQVLETIELYLAFPVTENEKAIVKTLREWTNNLDPKMFKDDQKEALKIFAESLIK